MEKIVKLLPQDIIINLSDNDEIKKQYFNHKYFYDIGEYIFERENIYKITIINTFNNIADSIPTLDAFGESIMISGINSEKELKNKILTIIYNTRSSKLKRYIILRFEQSDSQKLNFVIHFLKNNLEEESFYFICIVHIKRNFKNKNKSENIFNISNLYTNVDQLFIDNLNEIDIDGIYPKLNLKEILENPVKDFLKYINLEKDFVKTIWPFINKYLRNNERILKKRR